MACFEELLQAPPVENTTRNTFTMKKILVLLTASLWVVSLFSQENSCGPYQFKSYSKVDSSAARGWPEDTFQLSQNYPAEISETAFPWDKIDFTKKPGDYAKTILNYCLEGNDSINFVVQNNEARSWYHAPMVDAGLVGREFVHGLRMDRIVLPKELAETQTKPARSYAIGFYNNPGGYTIGQVWCDPKNPDLAKAKFPVGTVYFELVFTTADSGQVSLLANPYSWEAYIDTSLVYPHGEKSTATLNLTQVDILVRTDNSKAPNGWVAASYVFNGKVEAGDEPEAVNLADKLVPIGLAWGNDPEVTDSIGKLEQVWINPVAYNEEDMANSLVTHLGYGGRLAGPVDVASTSTLARYGTAGYPILEVVPSDDLSEDSTLYWSRNILAGSAFDPAQTSTDYSLLLAQGYANLEATKGNFSEFAAFRGTLADLEDLKPLEKAEEVVDTYIPPEGLEGSRMGKFIGFILLVVLLVGGLIYNLTRKDPA